MTSECSICSAQSAPLRKFFPAFYVFNSKKPRSKVGATKTYR